MLKLCILKLSVDFSSSKGAKARVRATSGRGLCCELYFYF